MPKVYITSRIDVFLLLLSSALFKVSSGACAPGHFGVNCGGVCRCLQGHEVCRSEDGACLVGACARGFTGHPYCQTPCPSGVFGSDCALTCRCPEGDSCDSQTGLCASGICLYGWDGPACQDRLPVFSVPPNVTVSIEGSMLVSWRAWNPVLDPGDPPIAAYSLEFQREDGQSSWESAVSVPSGDDLSAIFRHQVDNLPSSVRHRFRLRLYRLDNGKLRQSIPGPTTNFLYSCQGSPTTPTGVDAHVQQMDVNGATVVVTWNRPATNTASCGSVISHQVLVICRQFCLERTVSVPMPQTAVELTDVPYDGYLEISVYAMDASGRQSAQGAAVYLRTDREDEPTAVPTTDRGDEPTLAPTTEREDEPTVALTTDRGDEPTVAPTTEREDEPTVALTTDKEVEPPVVSTTDGTVGPTMVLTTDSEDKPASLPTTTKEEVVVTQLNTSVPEVSASTTWVPVDRSNDSPILVQMVSRTGNTLRLTWQSAATNYVNYKVTVAVQESYITTAGWGLTQQVSLVTESSVTLTGLLPSTLYLVTVAGYTSSGEGPVASLSLWTAPQVPAFPPSPTVAAMYSNGSVLLRIEPLVIDSGPLTGMEIVLEGSTTEQRSDRQDITSASPSINNRRRAVSNGEDIDALYVLNAAPYNWNTRVPSYDAAGNGSHTHYIAGLLSEDDVLAGCTFLVGDGACIEGYCNPPLVEGLAYTVWACVVSTLDGVSRRACSRAAQAVVPLAMVGASGGRRNTTAILAPILTLLILLAIVIVLCYVYRKYKHRDWANSIPDIATYHRGPTLSDLTFNESGVYTNQRITFGSTSSSESTALSSSTPDTQRERLKREFSQLPSGFVHPAEVALQPENKCLNRTQRVLPFDRNRVQLADNTVGTDYINASIVKVSPNQCYLVTQSPMHNTKVAFWQMVWDYQVERIIMLTPLKENDKEDCHYWDSKSVASYGDIRVEVAKEVILAFYSLRVLQVTKPGQAEVRHIHHCHYHAWLENGTPFHCIPFLDFIRIANVHGSSGMCMVHCRTGGGKSGMYVAMETLLSDYKRQRVVKLFDRVKGLRFGRPMQVSQFAQYEFIHTCLLETSSKNYEDIHISNIKAHLDSLLSRSGKDGRSMLFKEYNSLDGNPVWDIPENTQGNTSGIFVSPRPSVMGQSSLTFKTSFHHKARTTEVFSHYHVNAFLLMSSPCTPQQAAGMWREVWGRRCACVVMFGRTDEMVQYWPNDGNSVVLGKHTVTSAHTTCTSSQATLTRDFVITRNQGSQEHRVRFFQYLPWISSCTLPPLTTFLEFVSTVKAYTRSRQTDHPVVVHCSDGATRSGLFACVWTLVECAAHVHNVNIFQTVRMLRHLARDIVPSMDQYRFCYRAIKEYAKKEAATNFTSEHLQTNPPSSTRDSPGVHKCIPTDRRFERRDYMDNSSERSVGGSIPSGVGAGVQDHPSAPPPELPGVHIELQSEPNAVTRTGPALTNAAKPWRTVSHDL